MGHGSGFKLEINSRKTGKTQTYHNGIFFYLLVNSILREGPLAV